MFDNAMTKKQLKTLIIDDDQEHSAVISAAISQLPGAIVTRLKMGKKVYASHRRRTRILFFSDIVMRRWMVLTCRKLKANSRVRIYR